MLSPTQALRRILAALSDLSPLPPERVPLAGVIGRALAEDVRAPSDLPPFDASTMDGYALRAADARRASARLPVAFEVFAGRPAPGPLPAGACCRIATGAPLPPGADAVEMQEEAHRSGRDVLFARAAERWRFVRRRGSDLASGAVGLIRGTVLDPGAIGLAASLGRAELRVFRRPRVAILPTGDELASPQGAAAEPGLILESNGYAMAAAVLDAGAVPLLLPRAEDSAASLAAALEAARGCDALVTTGGTQAGPRDLLRAALSAAGARLVRWRVAIRPAGSFTFGRWDRAAVFGLPGTPGAALVSFEVFVRPVLRAMAGLPGAGRPVIVARLASAQSKPAALTVYTRVRLEPRRSGLVAVPLSRVPGALASLASQDGLAILPVGRDRMRRGSTVEVIVTRPPAT